MAISSMMGETLQERSKGKDVRTSNIIAAKVSESTRIGLVIPLPNSVLFVVYCTVGPPTLLEYYAVCPVLFTPKSPSSIGNIISS